MRENLESMIFIAGIGQFCVLIASALVPLRLDWKQEFKSLRRLHRQMYWVYGGYVVLAIVAFASISVGCAAELASGSKLARGLCAYIALFWGIRVTLQGVLDVKPHLQTWWLRGGYHLLTLFFIYFTTVYAAATFMP